MSMDDGDSKFVGAVDRRYESDVSSPRETVWDQIALVAIVLAFLALGWLAFH